MDKEDKGREGVWALLLSTGCWDRCRRDRHQESGPKEGGSVFLCRSGFKRGSWARSLLSSAEEPGLDFRPGFCLEWGRQGCVFKAAGRRNPGGQVVRRDWRSGCWETRREEPRTVPVLVLLGVVNVPGAV